MDTVECLGRSKLLDQVTCNRDPGISVGIKSPDDRFRYGQLRHLGCEFPRHRDTRQNHYTGEHRTVKVKGCAPTEKIVHGKGHLSQQEIRVLLPGRNRPKPGGDTEAKPFTDIFTASEPSCFRDHGANREIVRPSPSLGPVPVDEKEFVHSIRRCRQKIPVKSEHVAIPSIDARDRATPHELNLMSDRNA